MMQKISLNTLKFLFYFNLIIKVIIGAIKYERKIKRP